MAEAWYIIIDGTTYGNLDPNDLSPDWAIGSWRPLNDPVGTNRGQAYTLKLTVYFNYSTIGGVVDRWDELRQSLLGTHDIQIYDEANNLRFSFLQVDFVNGPQIVSAIPRQGEGRWNGFIAVDLVVEARQGNAAAATHQGVLSLRSSKTLTNDTLKELVSYRISAEGEFEDCLSVVQESLDSIKAEYASVETEITEEREEGRVSGTARGKKGTGGTGPAGTGLIERIVINTTAPVAPKIPIRLTGAVPSILIDGKIPASFTQVSQQVQADNENDAVKGTKTPSVKGLLSTKRENLSFDGTIHSFTEDREYIGNQFENLASIMSGLIT